MLQGCLAMGMIGLGPTPTQDQLAKREQRYREHVDFVNARLQEEDLGDIKWNKQWNRMWHEHMTLAHLLFIADYHRAVRLGLLPPPMIPIPGGMVYPRRYR